MYKPVVAVCTSSVVPEYACTSACTSMAYADSNWPGLGGDGSLCDMLLPLDISVNKEVAPDEAVKQSGL